MDTPDWGDSSEDEEREEEEEEEELQEEAEVEAVNDGDYPFDKGLFEDEKEELEDDDYYRDTEMRGIEATGRKLIAGGPTKPNTESMGKAEAEKVLKVWRK